MVWTRAQLGCACCPDDDCHPFHLDAAPCVVVEAVVQPEEPLRGLEVLPVEKLPERPVVLSSHQKTMIPQSVRARSPVENLPRPLEATKIPHKDGTEIPQQSGTEETKLPQQVEQERHHRAQKCPGRERRDQPWDLQNLPPWEVEW